MDIYDILLPPVYLLFILGIAHKYSTKKIKENPVYRYFLPGLIAKISGAIALGLVYFFYYGGGDTTNYHYTASSFVNLLFEDAETFNYVYFGKPSVSEYFLLREPDSFTYWVTDPYAFFVSKCFTPVVLICGKSYMASAVVVASICYLGVWRLYLVFTSEFPSLAKQLSWGILFVPSVVFWGSGIMKDSITFSATCIYVHGFYWFFVKRRFKLSYLAALTLSVYLLLSIKPYILLALLPGSVFWFVLLRLYKVKSPIIKFVITPSLVLIAGALGLYILQSMGDLLGKYSYEKVITTASTAQQDLKQSYYGGNTFNIGDYEATVGGMLSVSHKAIYATLFRPTLFDVRNIVMFISALENTFILLFCLYLLFKLKFWGFFRYITSHPLLMFSFFFAVFFAFSVGVSISNFGTLVRLKIPCIPFFVCSLVIINHMMEKKKMADKALWQLKYGTGTKPSIYPTTSET